ncbi:unnamed protein product [Orchesella dallaii]|uniref:Phospholipid scramblase n=1 Tax=Orchesella dallaii TaxID=48710 RepID=A0ABP1QDP8_9HEXA
MFGFGGSKSEQQKPPKSIIKGGATELSIIEPKNDDDQEPSSSKTRRATGVPPSGNSIFNLSVPSFFGGAKTKTGSESPRNPRASVLSVISTSSLSDHKRPGGRHVRFLDRLSWRSISALNLQSPNMLIQPGNDGDTERFHRDFMQGLSDDPHYLPGFADLHYSKEIIVKETSCCVCSTQTAYQILNEYAKELYVVEKHVDGIGNACAKICFFKHIDVMRVGFTICIFNTTVNAKLLTFSRRSHWFAEQLDIVETFYSIEDAHVGRIEKTKDGFRLMDTKGTELFRVLRDKKKEENLGGTSSTLLVINCNTRQLAAKISYTKRSLVSKIFSMFIRPYKHVIRWSQELEVTVKAMLIGVLFLELHSDETFLDLPLGRDAVANIPSKHRNSSASV